MKEEKFKVFDDEELGRILSPAGISYDEIKAVHISPLHGRAVALKVDEYKWISVKGGGWNYGGPQIYISEKDAELIFGLYSLDSAIRELEISKKIEEISDLFPKVLYYRNLIDKSLPKHYEFLQNIKYRNGEAANPVLLYTELKVPFRVADLIYFNDNDKKTAIEYCCNYWNIPVEKYTQKFTQELAKHVAILHKNGFINDTLDCGNVTMLSQIVDYEWVTAPGLKLPDGSYGTEIQYERKEKEILYGVEIVLQLKAMLQEEYSLFDIYTVFVEEYGKINPKFISSNTHIQKIIRKEKFVL